MKITYRASQAENGQWGVEVANTNALLYEAEFTKEQARALAKFHNKHENGTFEQAFYSLPEFAEERKAKGEDA